MPTVAGDCWQSVQRVSELFEHKEKQRLRQQTLSVKEKDRIRKQHVALLLLPVVTCDDARCESLIALGVGMLRPPFEPLAPFQTFSVATIELGSSE